MRKFEDLFIAIDATLSGQNQLPKYYYKKNEIEAIENYRNAKLISSKTKLKWPLLNKLYNSMLYSRLPHKKYSSYQRQIVLLVKQIAIAKILMALHARSSAVHLFENIYRKSKKLHFHEGVIESARKLFLYESGYRGNLNKAKSYYEDCTVSHEIMSNEMKAEWYVSELAHHFSATKEIPIEILKKSKHFLDDLKRVQEIYRSSRFLKFYSTLGILYYEASYDYNALCIFLKQNIKAIAEQFPDAVSDLNTLKIYLIHYNLRINNLKEAANLIEKILQSIVVDATNWFRVQELRSLLLLRQRKKKEGLDLLLSLRENIYFSALQNEIKLRIELLYYYGLIYYALSLPSKEAIEYLKGAKFQKFLNSVPAFNKDKKAMNIAIIIVQLLYFVLIKDYDKILEKRDAVKKYMSRYMKKDPLFRSHSFIKLLIEVQKQNFHPVAIKRHASKYRENLNQVPFLSSKHPIELELIEYEYLWDDLMTYLIKM
ncbi:MAG: hypothetical protein AAGA77_23475 [Bacteroidota bacterium]